MPTYEYSARFIREFHRLTPDQQRQFRDAVRTFVRDLKAGDVRAGLRIRPVSGHRGVFEMTRADDGRATFRYGDAVRPGETHIIWRRIGTHANFDEP